MNQCESEFHAVRSHEVFRCTLPAGHGGEYHETDTAGPWRRWRVAQEEQ